uniref:uncharacterized protein LOC120952005 n=1 Tax=Anopheles coluzzii TaxID=1518534 RepID=UPI0020FFB262|nr:uncharacterized protein LOC120952005 [Anopheles coluzzii]
MNQPSGSGYKHVGWKYFQVMSFLKDCYASRPREGNVPIRKDPVNEEYLEYDYNNNEVEHLDEDESYSIFDSESSRTATNSPAPSKKRKQTQDPLLEELLEVERSKQETLKALIETRPKTSSNYLFFNSLIEPVDALPLHVQLQVKESIMKVVHDAMLLNE